MTTPSPRSSRILSSSLQSEPLDNVRAESESGTSTVSETPELRSESEGTTKYINTLNIINFI